MFAALAQFLAGAAEGAAAGGANGTVGTSGGIDASPFSNAGTGNISGIGNNPMSSEAKAPDMSQPTIHHAPDAGTLLANLQNM